MSYVFYMPQRSFMGKNCLNDVGQEIKKLNFKKALIVTDKVLVDIKLINKLTKVLEDNEIEYVIFSGSQPNPTVKNVEEGLKILKDNNCDFTISFGGGSPHDCAKAISLVASNGGSIKDYEGLHKSNKPQLPLICVNTTAGTAAEMTIFCIITDEDRHIKMAIVDKNTTPMMAVNDPMLMVEMPKELTAATGMDALTHAIEALVSTAATPVTDASAVMAIELISKNLRKAVENGKDIEARDKMAYAEYLAGMAFNNASLGYVHAMAHQLGGFYDLPHGVCNAILLPHVETFNLSNCANKLRLVARAFGIEVKNLSDEEAAKKAIEEIKKLSLDVKIPTGLNEIGVKEKDFEVLAENALKDACSFTNPKEGTKEDVIKIFKSAF